MEGETQQRNKQGSHQNKEQLRHGATHQNGCYGSGGPSRV